MNPNGVGWVGTVTGFEELFFSLCFEELEPSLDAMFILLVNLTITLNIILYRISLI